MITTILVPISRKWGRDETLLLRQDEERSKKFEAYHDQALKELDQHIEDGWTILHATQLSDSGGEHLHFTLRKPNLGSE